MLTLGALSVPEAAQKVSTRTIFFTVCLFGAMVYWCFNAILVSFLTVNLLVLPINSLPELAAKSSYQLLLLKGDAFADFFSDSTNDVVRKIFDADIKGSPDAFLTDNR